MMDMIQIGLQSLWNTGNICITLFNPGKTNPAQGALGRLKKMYRNVQTYAVSSKYRQPKIGSKTEKNDT